MLAKTMKIAEQANFLSIEPSNWSPAAAGLLASRRNWFSTVKQRKLTVAGKRKEVYRKALG